MPNYVIDFQAKGTVILNKETNNREAVVSHPKLEQEIDLPIKYSVASSNEKLLGTLISFLPERRRIEMKNGSDISTLIIGGNEELILKSEGQKYDVVKFEMDDLEKEEADKLKQIDFLYGYKIRSSTEKGEMQLFSRAGVTRAILNLETSDFKKFLPVIMYAQIKRDLEGKTVKKQIPVKDFLRKSAGAEDGKFVKFVKDTFKPRFLEGAFPYQDQAGEKYRFFEYLDNGLRPVILNGPTGNGKSIMAKDYAFSRKKPFYFDTGNSSFRLSSAIGKFVPTPEGATFSPGSLTLAAISGGLYVMEEMAQIPQDELTGLNIFVETMELPVITQFGHEVIMAHPDFRFVATGNFHGNYTTNELNDAFLQRFTQIKLGYPTKDNTIDILMERAPGLDYDTAELITNVVMDMREAGEKFSKDLGLKGAVEVAQRIKMKKDIPLRNLLEDNIVNPITTYENHARKEDGKLYGELMGIVDKYV